MYIGQEAEQPHQQNQCCLWSAEGQGVPEQEPEIDEKDRSTQVIVTSNPFSKHLNPLNKFHMHRLRRMLGRMWKDRVTINEVLERCGYLAMHVAVSEQMLRWVCH